MSSVARKADQPMPNGEAPWVVVTAISLATLIAVLYFRWFVKAGNHVYRVMQEKTIAHKVEEFLRRSE